MRTSVKRSVRVIAAPRRSRRMRTTCHSMMPATSPTPIRYTAKHIASGVMAGVASSTTSAVHSASGRATVGMTSTASPGQTGMRSSGMTAARRVDASR